MKAFLIFLILKFALITNSGKISYHNQPWKGHHIPKGTCKCHFDPQFMIARDYFNDCHKGYVPYRKVFEEELQDKSLTLLRCECFCLHNHSKKRVHYQSHFYHRIT